MHDSERSQSLGLFPCLEEKIVNQTTTDPFARSTTELRVSPAAPAPGSYLFSARPAASPISVVHSKLTITRLICLINNHIFNFFHCVNQM